MSTETRERAADPQIRIADEQIHGKIQLINILRDSDPQALAMVLKLIPDKKLIQLFNDKDFLAAAFGSEQEADTFRQQYFEAMAQSYGKTVDPRFYATFIRLILSNPIKRAAWRDQSEKYIHQLTGTAITTFKKAIERTPNGRH